MHVDRTPPFSWSQNWHRSFTIIKRLSPWPLSFIHLFFLSLVIFARTYRKENKPPLCHICSHNMETKLKRSCIIWVVVRCINKYVLLSNHKKVESEPIKSKTYGEMISSRYMALVGQQQHAFLVYILPQDPELWLHTIASFAAVAMHAFHKSKLYVVQCHCTNRWLLFCGYRAQRGVSPSNHVVHVCHLIRLWRGRHRRRSVTKNNKSLSSACNWAVSPWLRFATLAFAGEGVTTISASGPVID